MNIGRIEDGGYGSREDDAALSVIDEEAQPLHMETFECGDGGTPITPNPRSMQRRQSLSYLEQFLPIRIQVMIKPVTIWLKGRNPPQIQVIKPWLPSIQAYPIKWLEKNIKLREHKILLLLCFCFCWIIAFGVPLYLSTISRKVEGSERFIQRLGCLDTFWRRGNACGLDGNDCRPFNGSSFAFRCPGNCAGVEVLNPRPVGAQEIIYRPLVIGGPIYRGDSFICGSAIHAGIVSNLDGGCGRVSRVGQHDNFPDTEQNGIASVAFDSYFPLSFTFTTDSSVKCGVKDLRWVLLLISLIFTTLLSLFTTSPSLQFFTIFTALFAHVSLVSDPPGISDRSVSVLPELFSNFAGRFLPAAFCAVVIYWSCVKRTLQGLTAQFEKTILWLGGCWIGALSNYAFDWLPISRLTPHDLEQQPGANSLLQ